MELVERIERTYHLLAPEPGAWVSLTRIADYIDATEAQITEAYRTLAVRDNVNVVPESNQKTLTEADRAAAVWIGNQWNHLISIR